MSGILKNIEKRIEKKVEERMGPIAVKLEEMIRVLKQIEENTRK